MGATGVVHTGQPLQTSVTGRPSLHLVRRRQQRVGYLSTWRRLSLYPVNLLRISTRRRRPAGSRAKSRDSSRRRPRSQRSKSWASSQAQVMWARIILSVSCRCWLAMIQPLAVSSATLERGKCSAIRPSACLTSVRPPVSRSRRVSSDAGRQDRRVHHVVAGLIEHVARAARRQELRGLLEVGWAHTRLRATGSG
jgi:hypothetical protein